MQTILGASGQIGEELARELHRNYTQKIRLVSRNPRKINDTDEIFPADLLDAQATEDAVKGSDIVYFTAGLPMDSHLTETQFPVMMQNTIHACKKHQCKLVFFDNTFMYPKDDVPQTEETPYRPVGRKSTARAVTAELVLKEINNNTLEAMICRAPEFYGPDKTHGITMALIFDNIKNNKKLQVPLSDTTLRSLIWSPDASRAMALIANSPDTFGHMWHLPIDRLITYKELIAMASEIIGKPLEYDVVKMEEFQLESASNPFLCELLELFPRYGCDNIFVDKKFRDRFPDFKTTSFEKGLSEILKA